MVQYLTTIYGTPNEGLKDKTKKTTNVNYC